MTKRSSDHALLALDLLAGNSVGEIIILELRAISPPPRYYFLSIVFAPRARTTVLFPDIERLAQQNKQGLSCRT